MGLDGRDLSALTRTCRAFYLHLANLLYLNNVQYHDSTVLFWAAKKGHLRSVEGMIAAGANVSKLRDYYRRTPLHDAALFGKRAVAEVLIDNGAELVVFEWSETSPIHEAVRRGHAEIAALLLSKGVDPNLRPPGLNIYSLLHVAAEHGRNAIAELLIQHGADVHLKLTITDATALHWALRPFVQNGLSRLGPELLRSATSKNAKTS
ncbi:hypothetical protein N7512_010504 [Penicillium capsulatum]|nr:hypothetical protein N7512_010504 [Penicillium capsulatum]